MVTFFFAAAAAAHAFSIRGSVRGGAQAVRWAKSWLGSLR